jgi:hypothetical protein
VRDAFNVMSIAGVPERLRVALVSDEHLAPTYLMRAERDLTRMNIEARLFADPDSAADWLAAAR